MLRIISIVALATIGLASPTGAFARGGGGGTEVGDCFSAKMRVNPDNMDDTWPRARGPSGKSCAG
jgi:hypothetical protein